MVPYRCRLCAGIDAAKAKYAEVPKLSVHFAADASGLLQVTKGEAVIETTEEYTVQVRIAVPPRPNGCTSFALCCEAVMETTKEYTVQVSAGIAPYPNGRTSMALRCLCC